MTAPEGEALTDESGLWRALASCPVESLGWAGVGWHVGYREAYRRGWDDGYRAAEHDMEIHWFALACKVRQDASRPSFAELQRRRGELAGGRR